MTVAEIITAAKALPPEDRQRVLLELQDTVDEDQPFSISPEWMAEIQRRIADADAHPGQGIPCETVHDEALARIRKHVGQ